MTAGTSWCWTCDLEHQAWARACTHCGGELHDEPPPVAAPRDHDTVEIDLSGMEPSARDLFLLFLDGAGIHHDVHGLLLCIAASDEQRTRDLLETITSDTLVEFDPAEPVDDTQWSRDMAAMMHPSAMLPPERVGDGGAGDEPIPAGTVRRAVAMWIGGLAWSLPLSLLVLFANSTGGDAEPSTWLSVVVWCVPMVGDVVLVARWGTTPGMFVLDMRVVDDVGGAPGWRASIVRMVVFWWPNLLYWLTRGFGSAPAIASVATTVWFLLIAVSIATGPRHQGWHDRLAGTWVVHGRFRPRVTA